MTCETFLIDWLTLHTVEIRPRTAESYQDLLTRKVLPIIGSVDLADLKPETIRHLLAGIVAEGHTRTAELCFVMLKAAFADLEPSPMAKVKRPKHHSKSPEPWNDEQMRVYLAACAEHPRGLALSLALLMGLRRGEICGLRWADVDLQAKILHIRNQRIRLATGELIDAPPKSEASNRSLPIPEQLLPAFRAARGLPSAYICPLTPLGLDAAHRKLVERLKLPPIPLHGLRHSLATAILRHGGDMRTLQSILGHASYATTANIYTHPDISMFKSSLDAVAKVCYTV